MAIRNSVCVALTASLFLTACSSHTQTTSGKAYLDRWAQQGGGGQIEATATEQDIIAAANVEPLLRLPARMGLARIENGRLSIIPGDEADSWLALAESLGPEFGQFAPISPLVAELVSPSGPVQHFGNISDTTKRIRLAAARQHMDAVLIYEVVSRKHKKRNILSLTDATILGLFLLPSRNVNVESYAQAVLIDVRNGYIYGSANAFSKEKTISTVSASNDSFRELTNSTGIAAVGELTPEIEQMMRELAKDLPKDE